MAGSGGHTKGRMGETCHAEENQTLRTRVALGTCSIIVTFLLMTALADAAEFQCTAGDGACLIAAINAANANGEENTITLAAGTYTLTAVDNDTDGPNGLPSVTSVLTIRGVEAETTIIERASNAPGFRIMRVAAVATLALEDVTLRHGTAGDVTGPVPIGGRGGGLFNAGGSVTLSRSILANHFVVEGSGGGLFNNGGTVTLTDSTLTGNSADLSAGGGLFNDGGTVTLTSSTLANDLVDQGNGGGFTNASGTVTITHSTIAENGEGGSCAGFTNRGTVILAHSTVADNEAINAVGGICNAGTLTITNSMIARNRADFGAGGLENSGTLTCSIVR